MAGHTKLATLKNSCPKQSIKAARALAAGEFDDAKLGALAAFTQAVMAKKARYLMPNSKPFFDAGYNQQQAVEVVMGVALATLCNYVNNVAQTEINPELQGIRLILTQGRLKSGGKTVCPFSDDLFKNAVPVTDCFPFQTERPSPRRLHPFSG